MKKIIIILSMAIAVFSFTALSAQSSKTTDKIATADKVVYQCPMKCEAEKTYHKAGKCPKCNMILTKVQEKKTSDNHNNRKHN